ncbi:uncharacterized protein C18orf63 homolog isoform X2 [Echinops telfairi]|nr:uncharacterized protein C18orf63 homolog isoform X2 [Echinops telfairi]
MSIPFYKTGKLNGYIKKCGAKMEAPERVIPIILQNCLSYSLIVRLAPTWNQTGHLLVQGQDFLSQMGKQSAVVLDINVTETQVCLSIEACTIRLPPPKLQEFNIPERVIKDFEANESAIIESQSIISNWCYVLPSMKMGQIINILHTAPLDCPFQSYRDFQIHWNALYGYKLPEARGDSNVFCSVYFRMIGEKIFTYPLSCIRSQPLQFFPRVDLEGVLKSFIADLKYSLPHICGFSIKMTNKPCYYTYELVRPPIQENKIKTSNLTIKKPPWAHLRRAPSINPTLTQNLPAHSVAADHKVATSASQPEPHSLPTPHLQPRSSVLGRQSTLSSGAPQTHLDVAKPSRSSTYGQDTHPASQNEKAPTFRPVFKTRLVQMNKQIPEPSPLRRKQLVTTEMKSFPPKTSARPGDRPNLSSTAKKRPHGPNQTHAGHFSQISRPQENDTEACANRIKHPLPGGNARAEGGKERKQRSENWALQKPGTSRSVATLQVNGKENVTSTSRPQVSGQGHRSGKTKRKPYIFESDTDMENQQLHQQHPVSQMKEVNASVHRSILSRMVHKSKRKLCQEMSRTSDKHHSNADLHSAPPNCIRNQVHDLENPKHKKFIVLSKA